MTARTGIGDAELFGEQRVWNGKAMIAARMALHIGGLWHVAIHAVVAALSGFVMSVRCRINLRRGGSGSGVADQAEAVSRDPRLR